MRYTKPFSFLPNGARIASHRTRRGVNEAAPLIIYKLTRHRMHNRARSKETTSDAPGGKEMEATDVPCPTDTHRVRATGTVYRTGHGGDGRWRMASQQQSGHECITARTARPEHGQKGRWGLAGDWETVGEPRTRRTSPRTGWLSAEFIPGDARLLQEPSEWEKQIRAHTVRVGQPNLDHLSVFNGTDIAVNESRERARSPRQTVKKQKSVRYSSGDTLHSEQVP